MVYAFGEFRFEAANLLLLRNSEVISLAPKAGEVLSVLIEAQGKLVTKQEILDRVWPDTFVEEANLTHHISALRKALGEDKNGRKFIETIPRRGYRFVASLDKPQDDASGIIISERITARTIEEIEIETNPPGRIKTSSGPLLLPGTSYLRRPLFRFFLPAAGVLLILALSFFAFRQWRQNNALRSFDGIRAVKLTTWKSTRGNDSWDLKSSHNGNMIAFSSTKDGNPGIYIKQAGGGEDIRITKDGWTNASPVWSPDDQQIMFSSVRENQAGIYVCPSLGGSPSLVKIIGEGNLSLRNWSGDGQAVFYEFNGNLFKLKIESREITPITDFSPDRKITRYFRVSPHEDKIAYADQTDGQTDLWLWNMADGSRKRLTDDADREVETAWNPDDDSFFYQVFRHKIYQIFLGYTDGREPVQVTRGDSNFELIDVSPDGTKLFYYISEDKSDIDSLNIETGEQSEAASQNESEFWSDVSPDGKAISYLLNANQYAMQRLVDSMIVVRQIDDKSAPLSFRGLNQKWLPDNQRIAFLRYDESAKLYNLWTFRLFDGEEKQITTAGITAPGTASFPYNRTQTRDFSWSGDSRQVIYIGAKRQNVFLISSDGEAQNLTGNENPDLLFHCPLWSPDGRKFAYVSSLKPASENEKPKWSVWIYEDGRTKEIFSTPDSLRFLGWTQSEELLFESTTGAMKSGATDIKLLQISPAGISRVKNTFDQISALSMALSPDTKTVAFIKEIDGKDDVYLAAIDKTEVKKLTHNTDSHTFFGSLSWQPDNRTVYFDKQERINTISVFENIK